MLQYYLYSVQRKWPSNLYTVLYHTVYILCGPWAVPDYFLTVCMLHYLGGSRLAVDGVSSSGAYPVFISGDNWSNVVKCCQNFQKFEILRIWGYNFEQAKINFEVNTGGQISIVLH